MGTYFARFRVPIDNDSPRWPYQVGSNLMQEVMLCNSPHMLLLLVWVQRFCCEINVAQVLYYFLICSRTSKQADCLNVLSKIGKCPTRLRQIFGFEPFRFLRAFVFIGPVFLRNNRRMAQNKFL